MPTADYALRATKVTVQALGPAMSTSVVQEHHLWLNLAEVKDIEKVHFLDAPVSQGSLFGNTVEGFAQQCSTVKKQTKAIKHIPSRRHSAPREATAPGPQEPSGHRLGRPQPGPAAGPQRSSRRHVANIDKNSIFLFPWVIHSLTVFVALVLSSVAHRYTAPDPLAELKKRFYSPSLYRRRVVV